MAPYDTVEEYTRRSEGYVEHVRIRRTDDDQYPSGWDYTLHYGTTEGETLLRYLENRRFSMTRRNGDAVSRRQRPRADEGSRAPHAGRRRGGIVSGDGRPAGAIPAGSRRPAAVGPHALTASTGATRDPQP